MMFIGLLLELLGAFLIYKANTSHFTPSFKSKSFALLCTGAILIGIGVAIIIVPHL